MVTDSIVFDRCNRAKKGKLGPVEVRVTIDRKSYYIGTGVKILRSEWLSGAVVDREDADILNQRIRLVRNNVMQEINACMEQGTPIDIEQIRKRVWTSGPKDKSMLRWIENQIPQLRLRDGSIRHYHTLMLRLNECQILVSWQDLTVDNLYKWDAWLHELPSRDFRSKVGDCTVYNYHKCLKAMLYRAVRMGVIKANPYDRMRGVFKTGDKETVDYLTEDELHRIEELELPEGTPLANARDLFVFQAYTGLSYSDAQTFDIKNYRMEDGMLTYIGVRIKTGVPYVCRLLPPAVAVLEKHGMQVPKILNSVYNRSLKMIGLAANIHTSLHSHIARHTFATYMLSKGVSLDSVSVMVGHTNTVQTRRYAKTLASTVKNDFDRIAEQLSH